VKDLFKFFFLCKPCEWVVAVEKGGSRENNQPGNGNGAMGQWQMQ